MDQFQLFMKERGINKKILFNQVIELFKSYLSKKIVMVADGDQKVTVDLGVFIAGNESFYNLVKEEIYNSSQERKTKFLHYKQIGNNYYNKENFCLAIIAYKKALKIDNLDSSLLTNIMLAYYKLGHFKSCEEYIDRVMYVDNKNIKALFRKAILLFEKHEFESAKSYFEIVYSLDNRNKESSDYVAKCEVYSMDLVFRKKYLKKK